MNEKIQTKQFNKNKILRDQNYGLRVLRPKKIQKKSFAKDKGIDCFLFEFIYHYLIIFIIFNVSNSEMLEYRI